MAKSSSPRKRKQQPIPKWIKLYLADVSYTVGVYRASMAQYVNLFNVVRPMFAEKEDYVGLSKEEIVKVINLRKAFIEISKQQPALKEELDQLVTNLKRPKRRDEESQLEFKSSIAEIQIKVQGYAGDILFPIMSIAADLVVLMEQHDMMTDEQKVANNLLLTETKANIDEAKKLTAPEEE